MQADQSTGRDFALYNICLKQITDQICNNALSTAAISSIFLCHKSMTVWLILCCWKASLYRRLRFMITPVNHPRPQLMLQYDLPLLITRWLSTDVGCLLRLRCHTREATCTVTKRWWHQRAAVYSPGGNENVGADGGHPASSGDHDVWTLYTAHGHCVLRRPRSIRSEYRRRAALIINRGCRLLAATEKRTLLCTPSPNTTLYTITEHYSVHHHRTLLCTPSPNTTLYTITEHYSVHHHRTLLCTPSPNTTLYTITEHYSVHHHRTLLCTPSPNTTLYTITAAFTTNSLHRCVLCNVYCQRATLQDRHGTGRNCYHYDTVMIINWPVWTLHISLWWVVISLR